MSVRSKRSNGINLLPHGWLVPRGWCHTLAPCWSGLLVGPAVALARSALVREDKRGIATHAAIVTASMSFLCKRWEAGASS